LDYDYGFIFAMCLQDFVSLKVFAFVSRGRDGIVGLHAAAAEDFAHRNCLVPGQENRSSFIGFFEFEV
jgi:hypothetical protein